MSIHDIFALQLRKCQEETNIDKRVINGKTTLIQKDPENDTISSDHKTITCLLIRLKILSALIREEIYHSQECCELFAEEQKGCH